MGARDWLGASVVRPSSMNWMPVARDIVSMASADEASAPSGLEFGVHHIVQRAAWRIAHRRAIVIRGEELVGVAGFGRCLRLAERPGLFLEPRWGSVCRADAGAGLLAGLPGGGPDVFGAARACSGVAVNLERVRTKRGSP